MASWVLESSVTRITKLSRRSGFDTQYIYPKSKRNEWAQFLHHVDERIVPMKK